MDDVLPDRVLGCVKRLAVQGKYDRALAILHDLERVRGASSETQMLRGKILAQQGEYESAITAWCEVVRREPHHPAAQAALARADRIAFGQFGAVAKYSGSYLATIVAGGLAVMALIVAAGFAETPAPAEATPVVAPLAQAPTPPAAAAPGAWEARLTALETELRSLADRVAAPAPPAPAPSSAQLERRLAGLEQRLAAWEARRAEPPSAADLGLDELRRAVAAAEQLAERHRQELAARLEQTETAAAQAQTQAALVRDELHEKLAGLGDRLRELRRDALMWRAYDLSIQAPATELQLASLTEIAKELSSGAFDEPTQQYARQLVQWIQRQKPAAGGTSEPRASSPAPSR